MYFHHDIKDNGVLIAVFCLCAGWVLRVDKFLFYSSFFLVLWTIFNAVILNISHLKNKLHVIQMAI